MTKKSIKVYALTGGENTPSTRFRVRQHIGRLAGHGVEVTELIPRFGASCGLPSPFKMASRIPAFFHSRDADIVWLSRNMVKGYAFFERSLKHPRVLDVDDAIWLSRPFGRWVQPWIAQGMDAVIAGNQYLADYYTRYCKNVHIVPTAIDLKRYQKRSLPEAEPEKFTIVWTGLSCNYKYVKLIEEVLGLFLKDHPRADLLLIANRPWKKMQLPKERVRYLQWSAEMEASSLQGASVGIMPLSDDPWTRGKCSFKMLQYMAVGLPVIASPVGMNRDVLGHGKVGFGPESANEWYDALKMLYNNRPLQQQMGNAGRKVVEETYNADRISEQLAGLFRQLI
jgi:glycosyltransferase involved in cell wall biosynthesis